MGEGTGYSIQSRPFQKVQTVQRHGISWLFCLKHHWPFELKVKVPKYPEKPSFGFFPPSKSWRLDLWHSKKTLPKEMVRRTSSVIWWQSVYLNESCEIFSRVAFLRSGIFLRRLQTLHWQLSKNGLIQPLSSLSPGCSTDVIIRVPASEKSSCSGCHPPFSHH